MLDRKAIIEAVDQHRSGDSELLDLWVIMLNEHSEAKNTLRQKGYGFTGMNLVVTAREVPESEV